MTSELKEALRWYRREQVLSVNFMRRVLLVLVRSERRSKRLEHCVEELNDRVRDLENQVSYLSSDDEGRGWRARK